MSYEKKRSSYKYLRVWRCLAKVVVSTPKKMKIGPKTVDCIFIGYAHNSNAYKFLVYESENPDIHKNTIMESRNASFFEKMFPCKYKDDLSSSKRTYEIMNDEIHDSEEEQGCLAKVVVPTPKKMKIGHKTVDYIFIGYAHNSNAYRFLVHESENPNIHKNAIMEARNALFFENVFPCKSKYGSSSSK